MLSQRENIPLMVDWVAEILRLENAHAYDKSGSLAQLRHSPARATIAGRRRTAGFYEHFADENSIVEIAENTYMA